MPIKKVGKLRAALANHQGRDMSKEHSLKKQKAQVKKAEEKRAPKQSSTGFSSSVDLKSQILRIMEEPVGEEDAEDIEEEDGEEDDWETLEKAGGAAELEDDVDDEDEDEDKDNEGEGVPLEDDDQDSGEAEANEELDSGSEADEEDLAGPDGAQLPIKMSKAKITTVEEDDEDDEDDDEAASEASIPLSDLSLPSDDDTVPHTRLTINNEVALTAALKRIALPLSTLPFSTHQTVTSTSPTHIPDPDDDLNRELSLYAQSLAAVKSGRQLLLAEDPAYPFTRPTDYFAEMVKTDEHMGKVKERLVRDAAGKRASADAKRQREAKKFGKAVQQERLKERAGQKRDMLDKVKSLKRKRQDGGIGEATREEELFDVALDDAAKDSKAERRAKPGVKGEPNRKRNKKDSKFGFGGKKRFAKSNDAASAGDMSGFSTRKMKGGPKTGAAKRPGKNRRAAKGN